MGRVRNAHHVHPARQPQGRRHDRRPRPAFPTRALREFPHGRVPQSEARARGTITGVGSGRGYGRARSDAGRWSREGWVYESRAGKGGEQEKDEPGGRYGKVGGWVAEVGRG